MIVRQGHAPLPVLRHTLPLSMAFDLIQAKTNRENWNGRFGYIGSGTQNGPFAFWQLGWVGGLLNTLPLLSDGSESPAAVSAERLTFCWKHRRRPGFSGRSMTERRWSAMASENRTLRAGCSPGAAATLCFS